MTARTTPTTGPGSTSFQLHLVALLISVASAVEAILQPGTSVHTAVFGGGGILLALGSTIAKLMHDKGIHMATIQAAYADVLRNLPQIEKDIQSVGDFLVNQWPSLRNEFGDALGRLQTLETKIADIPGLQQLARAVAQLLASGVTSTPVDAPPVPPAQ